MKLSIVALIFGASTLVFSSCLDKHSYSTSNTDAENLYGIELINNKKWKVDDKMLFRIHIMEERVAIFLESNDIAYTDLANTLKNDIQILVSSCTMSGKAHEELHKWLHPFMELVEQLEQSRGGEVGAQKLNEINKSFIEFNKYFE